MRSSHFLSCQAMLAVSFIACDQLPLTPPPAPKTEFKLNLPIGRSWAYADTVRTTGARTELVARLVIVAVIGKDSLSPELRDLLKMRVTTKAQTPQGSDSLYDSFVWYRHDDGGLWEVAYQNSQNVFAYPRAIVDGSLLSEGEKPSNPAPSRLGPPQATSGSSITIRAEPRLVLKYPLREGDEWVAFQQPFRRTLKCLRLMSMQVPAGEFTAYELQGAGTADPTVDFKIYDYFCAEGLVRRELYWRNLQAFSPSGQLLPHPIHVEEVMVLMNML